MSGTSRFRAVIFDMDGVLVDTEYFYADELVAFSRDHGLGLTRADACALVGTSHQTFRRKLVEWFGAVGRPLTEDEGEALYYAWRVGRACDYRALLNPGAVETVAALKRAGVRVALASSSPRANIELVLSQVGLAGAFEHVVSGEQFAESKPEPDIYLHALGLLGLPADACCCVEDSVPGITAGKRAGLTVFAKREERFGFSQEAADAIIDRLPDLLPAIGLAPLA